MVSYCVDLTSVYGFTIGKFILLCLQVFIKGCLLWMLQFCISHLNINVSSYCLDCENGMSWQIFHVIFGVSLRFLIYQNSSYYFYV